jgi:leucyl/phenylalanyl-tRNA--protein transferase
VGAAHARALAPPVRAGLQGVLTVPVFPDPRESTPEGVVAVGGDLRPETLRAAYRRGIFPWPHEGLPLLWFCPPRRAVLERARLHLPRSLRAARKKPFAYTVDRAFRAVIEACALSPRPGQRGTWITPDMVAAYCRLHRLGGAHSVEAWEGGELVGGVYGVDAGGAFSGESMFHRRPDASKLALLHLLERLSARGLEWIDIQQLTPHLERLGARELAREEFLARWERELSSGRKLF